MKVFTGLYMYMFALLAAGFGQTSSGSIVAPIPAHLVNMSVRTITGLAPDVGFWIAQNPSNKTGGTMRVLIRAVGPTLANYGFPWTYCQNPALTLYSGQTVIASNTGWDGSASTAAVMASVGAFTLNSPNADERDAVLIVDLPPGGYTVMGTAQGSFGDGTVLLEIYVIGDDYTKFYLSNLSCMAYAATGDSALVLGFYTKGAGTQNLLIRAAGPALASLPTPIPGYATNPSLTLVDQDSHQVIGTDENWGDNGGTSRMITAFASVGAFPFPTGSADAAMLVNLPAGGDTASVGVGGHAGKCLIELYSM